MPTADTAYIIGVIRETEKAFLGEDEYTRLKEAPDAAGAVQVLIETPYGPLLGQDGAGLPNVLLALETHLRDVHRWLADVLGEVRVWQFMAAKYDATNLALALLAKRAGQELPEGLSELGSIDANIWQSALWHSLGFEQMPEFWERNARELLDDESLSDQAIVDGVAQAAGQWQKHLAFTPLMEEISALNLERAEADKQQRPFGVKKDASEYEREWDERLLTLLRKYRLAPTGYDPIICYWYGKTIEVRQLRLMLTAKFNGMAGEELGRLQRSAYRAL